MTDTPPTDPKHNPEFLFGDAGTELASQRTAMAFARTRVSADRTLLAIMRTAISLIGFGFTIFSFFHTLGTKYLPGHIPEEAPRRFAAGMILLGMVLLVFGIFAHIRDAKSLNARRARLLGLGLVRHMDAQNISLATAAALGLFLLGLAAILSIVFHMGPLE